jgi:hypothetical protein
MTKSEQRRLTNWRLKLLQAAEEDSSVSCQSRSRCPLDVARRSVGPILDRLASTKNWQDYAAVFAFHITCAKHHLPSGCLRKTSMYFPSKATCCPDMSSVILTEPRTQAT